ncbi:glyceraldehyde 3-phosphate dehydrogenase NAD-binding domain-containing protein [Rhizobium sp. 768_B6_N1_8]|uniref:glyceraldehyde 3-phosphate dehydrogenase NAD-binding domain-containing protein n=1 Tax=unclassified Rhizobium TaxID=2613769 RepID=UPI003F2153B8
MTKRKTTIAINGLGRIGRSILRILLQQNHDLDLVLINDVAVLESCAYLFQYDSIFGPWKEEVTGTRWFWEPTRRSSMDKRLSPTRRALQMHWRQSLR